MKKIFIIVLIFFSPFGCSFGRHYDCKNVEQYEHYSNEEKIEVVMYCLLDPNMDFTRDRFGRQWNIGRDGFRRSEYR